MGTYHDFWEAVDERRKSRAEDRAQIRAEKDKEQAVQEREQARHAAWERMVCASSTMSAARSDVAATEATVDDLLAALSRGSTTPRRVMDEVDLLNDRRDQVTSAAAVLETARLALETAERDLQLAQEALKTARSNGLAVAHRAGFARSKMETVLKRIQEGE